MSLLCEACQKSNAVVWAHNGGMDVHRWDATGDEQDCTCSPRPVCVRCEIEVLRAHAFIVLNAELFGPQNTTIQ